MKTLALTSPLTAGDAVHAAQSRLNGHNAFNGDYLAGAVDGKFGPETARACRRAKYWLGYPSAQQTPIYGDLLDKYLTGRRRLPVTYRARRAARIKAAARATLGARAVDALWQHRGLTESPPGSNVVAFSSWYGVRGPWCAMAATWAFVTSGSKAFARGTRFAYVPFLVIDAVAGANGIVVTREPRRGDIVCFDWDGTGQDNTGGNPYGYDHTGLFVQWLDHDRGSFQTIEGNTSSDDRGSQSNGGGLYTRKRSFHTARVTFLRVGR